MSVKRSIRRERPEVVLFERSEFTDDSERRMRSSETGVALIFCLLFHQGKSRFNYFYNYPPFISSKAMYKDCDTDTSTTDVQRLPYH